MFQAKYDSRCPSCGNAISVGDDVTMVDSDRGRVTVHVQHVEDGEMYVEVQEWTDRTTATMPRGKSASDRCNRCFIVHASGQEECE